MVDTERFSHARQKWTCNRKAGAWQLLNRGRFEAPDFFSCLLLCGSKRFLASKYFNAPANSALAKELTRH
jgi:hypothetical protein